MKCKVKRFFAKIRNSIKLRREYYGWYYPALKNLLAKREELIRRKSIAFREENEKEHSYFEGQVDIINDLMEVWHGKGSPTDKN